jgi:tRNA(Ile)-lysidine synthetase-like protein
LNVRGARPEASIEQALERDGVIVRGERLVIACSGGADSVALAAAAAAVRTPMALEVTIAHVDHGTRASAWQDECVVLRVGAALGLPVRIAGLTACASDEASLRAARYEALAAIARAAGATAVVTAHHREDQAETVLLALFRGAGPEGLRGMPSRRELVPGIDLVRPLLRVGAAALRQSCHAHALPYAVDPTNASGELRRNAVRAALETLRPLFPGLDAAVARAADVLAEEFAGTPRAGLRRRVREALRTRGGLRDVDFEHVESAVHAIERGRSGRFHMKAGVELHIQRGAIMRKEP